MWLYNFIVEFQLNIGHFFFICCTVYIALNKTTHDLYVGCIVCIHYHKKTF